MVAEVPLYRDRPEPPADSRTVDAWLAQVPTTSKRELRKGFPKSLVRRDQDLHAAMQRRARDAARDLGHHRRPPPGDLGMVVVGSAGARSDASQRADRAIDGARGVSRSRAHDARVRRRRVPLRHADRGRAQHRRHAVLQRERRPDALDREGLRADAARVDRVRPARSRSGSRVSRDRRARRRCNADCDCLRPTSSRSPTKPRRARCAATSRARSTHRCSRSTARPKPACCSWSASTGGCTRTSATVTSTSCRCRARRGSRACS